jgi:hypothetical protein
MSKVAEIKMAIEMLSPQERCELDALLHPWPDDDWDRQMQVDAEPGGKLYEMTSAARKNAQTGKLEDFPPREQKRSQRLTPPFGGGLMRSVARSTTCIMVTNWTSRFLQSCWTWPGSGGLSCDWW